jgi:hypothetical protein
MGEIKEGEWGLGQHGVVHELEGWETASCRGSRGKKGGTVWNGRWKQITVGSSTKWGSA